MRFDYIPVQRRGTLPKPQVHTGPAPAGTSSDVPEELPDEQDLGPVGDHRPVEAPTTLISTAAPSELPSPEPAVGTAPSLEDTPPETGAPGLVRSGSSDRPGARDVGPGQSGPGAPEAEAEAAQPALNEGGDAVLGPNRRCGNTSSVPTGSTFSSEDRAGDVRAPSGLSAPLEYPSCSDDPSFCPEPGNGPQAQEGSGPGTFHVPAEASGPTASNAPKECVTGANDALSGDGAAAGTALVPPFEPSPVPSPDTSTSDHVPPKIGADSGAAEATCPQDANAIGGDSPRKAYHHDDGRPSTTAERDSHGALRGLSEGTAPGPTAAGEVGPLPSEGKGPTGPDGSTPSGTPDVGPIDGRADESKDNPSPTAASAEGTEQVGVSLASGPETKDEVSLGDRDLAIARALGRGRSHAATAKLCEVSTKTVQRRLDNPIFREEVARQRRAYYDELPGLVTRVAPEALQTVLEVMRSRSTTNKLRAAGTVLDHAHRYQRAFHQQEMESRIETLERALTEYQQRGAERRAAGGEP